MQSRHFLSKPPTTQSAATSPTVVIPHNRQQQIITSSLLIREQRVPFNQLANEPVGNLYNLSLPPPHLLRRARTNCCLLYTSPSPRDRQKSRMPSSA